jgi:hypothetical protein
MSSHPPVSGPQPLELRSLATISVALLTCQHPERGRVSANVIVTAQRVRITWCSFCGAIAADEGSCNVWQRAAFTFLLSSGDLAELSLMLHALGRWHAALLPSEGAPAGPAPLPAAVEQDLRAALPGLTNTALYRDLDRLDRAIAALANPDPALP